MQCSFDSSFSIFIHFFFSLKTFQHIHHTKCLVKHTLNIIAFTLQYFFESVFNQIIVVYHEQFIISRIKNYD